jgi:hypothetical protein
MEREVRGDVKKVQLFSRFARAACVLAMVFMGAGFLWLMLGVLFGFRGIKVSFGPYLIEGADFTTLFLGLVLPASWIMEVGRRTQDEADDLRRDAELVI